MRVIIRIGSGPRGRLVDEQDAPAPDAQGLDLRTVWCHRCGSRYVRLAKFRGALDLLLRSIGYYPFRCYACGGRFRSFAPKA